MAARFCFWRRFFRRLSAQADWPGYGRDKGAQRYSPLTQINTGNVAKLIPAWTFSMKREGCQFRPEPVDSAGG